MSATTSAIGRDLEGDFRIVRDDERENERYREALEGNFHIVGDDERDDKRNRPVNLVIGGPHK